MDLEIKLERVKQLVMKKLAGTLTASEDEELDKLVREDGRCWRLVDRLLAPDFLARAVLEHNSWRVADSWASLYGRIGYKGGVLHLRRHLYRWVGAVAAVLVLVVGVYVWWSGGRSADDAILPGRTLAEISWPDGEQAVYTTDMLTGHFAPMARATHTPSVRDSHLSPDLYTRIVVPQGSEYRVRLDDGTQIHLNAESSLTVPVDFSPHNRHVNLSGEAYLEVSKDSLYPFTVHTEKADIRVRDTRLNVRCRDDEPKLEVVLASGRLDVLTPRQEVSLPVGCMACVDKGGDVTTTPADVYAATAWHQGRFVFDDRPMDYIMHELERWYDIRASFSSDEVREMRFTLDFDRYDTFGHFLKVLRMIDEVDIVQKGNQVLLSKREH